MGKKITVYLIDGTDYSPRIAEIGNWVGKGVYSPRAAISKIIDRDEFNNPGVYCLKGEPANEAFSERIYIGEAENIKVRLKQHLADPKKDFSDLIFFVSKDELLTKTQIKYLESRLVQMAIESKNAEIDNGNNPSIPTLHEADISDMEYFLEQIKLLLPVLGFQFLMSATSSDSSISKAGGESQKKFFIKTKTYNSVMVENERGYIVLKGSEAKKDLSASCTETYRKMRKKLLDTGLLAEDGTKLSFTDDTVFTSPSAAANMVLGRNSNGFIEWVDAQGNLFKDQPA